MPGCSRSRPRATSRSNATPTTCGGSPTPTRRSGRSLRRSRSSCSPTTSRSPAAPTSISRATWRSRSRLSRFESMPADEAAGRAAAVLPEVAGGGPRPHAPDGTTELGIDIIKVDRIRASIERFGERFSKRVLTVSEQRYVRDRPETFAGRWAAKEAVSKVLGLGVRGIGWRDIEIDRMPTGQPAVSLHGRAAARAEQLGMGRVAVSITHEADYA